tara:strand:- start:326 stop:466 length:141 start_codon:yes stop_codon:yes gene_type:complete
MVVQVPHTHLRVVMVAEAAAVLLLQAHQVLTLLTLEVQAVMVQQIQ